MPPSFRPRSHIENGFGPFGRGGSAWTEFFLLAGEYAYKDVQVHALERIVEHFVQLRLSRGRGCDSGPLRGGRSRFVIIHSVGMIRPEIGALLR